MGGSMGAPQTYEWAVRYPEMVKRAAPIAGNPKVTPHEFAFLETLKEAITSDLAWQGGWYTEPNAVQKRVYPHLRALTRRFDRSYAAPRAEVLSSKDNFRNDGGVKNSPMPALEFIKTFVIVRNPDFQASVVREFDILCTPNPKLVAR